MPTPQFPDDLALALHLDRSACRPLRRQLIERLRELILAGQLAAGRRLPGTRVLARTLGIARNVAESAYDELWTQGYVVRRQGSGTMVADDLAPVDAPFAVPLETPAAAPRWLRASAPEVASPSAHSQPPITVAFTMGAVSLEHLPAAVWRAAWRQVGAQPPSAYYGSPAGDHALRAAVAGYLARARGMRRDPDDIIITSGATQAIDLIVRALHLRGDPVAIEEPGYGVARMVLRANGAHLIPVPVDDDGLRVDALAHGAQAPLMVYVTPAHQYPLGVRLSIARRMALLAWASANDSLIVEDDYDSEFRFDAPPLPALAGLDTEGRVAYVGTFSKVLAPALRVGYLVVPSTMRNAIIQLKSITDFHTSWATQRALLALITEGQLERHIRRMRRIYAEKRAQLHAIFAPISQLARLGGMEAGLHACLQLRAGPEPAGIIAAARARGVFAAPLDGFFAGTPDRQGLVLGYGGLDLTAITSGAIILREEIERCAGA